MSEVVRQRPGWVFGSTSPEAVGTMENTAAVAEVAVRAAAGIIGVRVVTALVRHHPILSLLFASGIGYVLGHGRSVAPDKVPSAKGR